MSLTFGQAKEILCEYAGKAGKSKDSPEAAIFTLKVLQYMIISGTNGALRKFTFNAFRGMFTAPYELETPLKVKIDRKTGDVWSKWFDFQSQNDLQGKNCEIAENAIVEDGNYAFTAYGLPDGGARVAVMGTCDEAEDAHIIVQGLDMTGREIFTTHRGKQVTGEYLSIKKGQLIHTSTVFGTITGITKTRTNGYTQLYWLAPTSSIRGFLADYSPIEENPYYRRFRLINSHSVVSKVEVLGRIRLKPSYSDNDRIPFDNLFSIQVAGQSVQSQGNNDIQTAQAKDGFMQELLVRENEHKRVTNGQPIEVFKPLSAGSIKNII